jgi:hypothetical protein
MYGRAREARDLFDLLVSERIVLLHSPSGAGKSSLIQAALIPHLIDEDEGFRVLPLIRVNEPPRQPIANRYLYSLLHSLENMVPLDQRLPIETLAQLSLAGYLEQRLSAQDEAQSIVFIFDQFEEILSLDPTDGEAKADFFTQVGYALRDQQRWALFAMREDYLGALEPYRRFMPTRLDNTFRLELLGPDAADQAIQKPALSCAVDFQMEAVQQLRDDLRKMRVQQPDGQAVERLGPYIEPVQLQVVCSRLWEEYGASGQITLDNVKSIGNVDEALADYYAASVKRPPAERRARTSGARLVRAALDYTAGTARPGAARAKQKRRTEQRRDRSVDRRAPGAPRRAQRRHVVRARARSLDRSHTARQHPLV